MAEQNRPIPAPVVRADRASNESGFSLRSIDSADRMTRSLSPWVQEMLNGETTPANQGSLVHRLLVRRTDQSISFLTTIALLKRFHRVATQTSAWKANVGSVSPNLFEQFSQEMFKNWDIGANNIGALLKINRQEEALEMPLAGEVGGPAAAQPQQPATPPMTMEEIRRRVSEARQFGSMSPSAVPNFVKSQEPAQPASPPGTPPPGAPLPSQRPPMPPIARPLPGQTPPTPPSASAPTGRPATPAPRAMRRRMARSVEYLSIPSTDGDDGDAGASGDDSEPSSPQQYDTGPPGLDWFFPPPEEPENTWFLDDSPQTGTRDRVRPHTRPVVHTQRRLSTSAVGDSGRSLPGRVNRQWQRPTPTRPSLLRSRPFSAPSIGQSAVDRLALITSGQLLASRPQLLLDHLQRKANPPTREEPQPTADAGLRLAPVSLTEFALAYPQRLLRGADDGLLNVPETPVPSPDDAVLPVQANRAERPVGKAVLQTRAVDVPLPLAPQPTAPARARRAALSDQSRSSRPILALAQSQPLRPPPTVMRLAAASPLSPGRVRPLGAAMEQADESAENQAPSAVMETPADRSALASISSPVLGQELFHNFEPVSAIWRASQRRNQSDAASGLPMRSPLPTLRAGADGISRQVASARLLPLDLAPIVRPTPAVAAPQQALTPVATPPQTLIERVTGRDFAGTRRDLLADGPLAVGGQALLSAPSRAATQPGLIPSARAQTRQMVHRSAVTDLRQMDDPDTFLNRPRGLRLPVRSNESRPRPAGNGPRPFVPPSVTTRLGEVAVMAQRRGLRQTRLEPVSALWRGELLTPESAPPLPNFRPGADRGGPQPDVLPLAPAARFFRTAPDAGPTPGILSAPGVAANDSGTTMPMAPARAVPRVPSQTIRRRAVAEPETAQRPRAQAPVTLFEQVARRLWQQSGLPAAASPSGLLYPDASSSEAVAGVVSERVERHSNRSRRQPGETGQNVTAFGRHLQRAVTHSPVSAAWWEERAEGDGEPLLAPLLSFSLPGENLLGENLPGAETAALSVRSARTLAGLPLRRLTPARIGAAGTPSAAGQEALPVDRPGAPTVQRFVRAPRPLPAQILGRDFANTRQEMLQADPAIAARSGRAGTAASEGNPQNARQGSALTSTLVGLTSQPAFRHGLPRLGAGQPATRSESPIPVLGDGVIRRAVSPDAGAVYPAFRLPLTRVPARLPQRRDAGDRVAVAETDLGDASVRDGATALIPGALGRAARNQTERQVVRRRLEPVSDLWRSGQLTSERSALPSVARDVAGTATISGDELLRPGGLGERVGAVSDGSAVSPTVAVADFVPLELTLNRLLGQANPRRGETMRPSVAGEAPAEGRAAVSGTGRLSPAQPATQAVAQLEAGGWRFKRSSARSSASAPAVEGALRGLADGRSRVLPTRPRTLLERVLQRDFAGVRVQMASLGPLGIEAAAQGNTVYLSRERANLDRPDTLALLGHELTHVAASGSAPLVGESVQRSFAPGELPLAQPLAPSLSQRLSRQLVRMSLGEEERTAEAVESALRRGVQRQPATHGSDSQLTSGFRQRRKPRGSIDEGSHSVAQLVQRRLANSRFSPVSQSWPAQDFAPVVGSAAQTVDLLEDQGWRFKRSGRISTADGDSVQRAAAELTARSAGSLPLPARPRTLMERVLQRDFSGVRLQAAGLEPLGVEAAARGQTVYLQRSSLARLEQPETLALLGHELTHVAASTNPPLQRSVLPGQNGPEASSSQPVALTLPPFGQIRRSVRSEESAAVGVEQGIRSYLRQNPGVQRDPLSSGPVKTNGKARVSANGRQGRDGNGSRSNLPEVQRVSLIGQPILPSGPGGAGPHVQRATREGTLDGVSTEAMPVVQRSTRRGASSSSDASSPSVSLPVSLPDFPQPITRIADAPASLPPIQRTVVNGNDFDFSDEEQEPDWDLLADKVYPLIVRMLRMERERRPL